MRYLIIVMIFLSSVSYSNPINELFKNYTDIEDPFSLRDPFQTPKMRSESSKKRAEMNSGILIEKNELSEDVDINTLIIVGVLIGKNRRALIKVNNKTDVYTLKEGDTLGPNGPEIKAILAGGIILADKITNIYGQDEYIETAVPISR